MKPVVNNFVNLVRLSTYPRVLVLLPLWFPWHTAGFCGTG